MGNKKVARRSLSFVNQLFGVYRRVTSATVRLAEESMRQPLRDDTVSELIGTLGWGVRELLCIQLIPLVEIPEQKCIGQVIIPFTELLGDAEEFVRKELVGK